MAQGPRPRAGHGRGPVQLGGLAPSRLSAAIGPAPNMKHYVICHMNGSVDGRILGSRWRPPRAACRGCSSACTSSSAAAPGSSYETPAAADPIGESLAGARPGRLMRGEFGAGEEA